MTNESFLSNKFIVFWLCIVSCLECDVPPSTLNKALSSYLDICSTPSPDIMVDWNQFASDETEKEAILKLCEDSQLFREWRGKYPNVLDFLTVFSSIKIPAASLVATLPKLIPRAYSIASIDPKFSLVGGQNIPVTDLVLETIEFEAGHFLPDQQQVDKPIRKGVCSGFLTRLPIGGRFLSYHHANAQFKMPNDPNLPIIMVGTGSGIAPFRAFWQHRTLLHWPKTSAWLYFGCQDDSENLFEEETVKSIQRRVAFSRMPNKCPKQYVQDLLNTDKASIYDLLLSHNAHVYICGKVWYKLIGDCSSLEN